MDKKFVAIGHVTEDKALPENVVGGGVSYGGIAAMNLGLNVDILTKLPPGHRFIEFFKRKGITIHTLPTKSSSMTTFVNRYDASGRRVQTLEGKQEAITINEVNQIPAELVKGAICFVAPVIGEVDTKIIPYFAQAQGFVVVSPQGYFRGIHKSGEIFQKEWENFESVLPSASATIFSEEDITIHNVFNKSLLDRIRNSSNITIVTSGGNGAILYQKGHKEVLTYAFPLQEGEVKDFTGAGDAFATAFAVKFSKTGNAHEAAVFANLFAGIKIAGLGGGGIDSIPRLQQIETFLSEHPVQLKTFLRINNADEKALTV